MSGQGPRGPRAGGPVAELVLAGVVAAVLVLAGAVWIPVSLTDAPGYQGQALFAVPFALGAGQIRWTVACTFVALAELVLLTILIIGGVGVVSWWRGRRSRVDHAANRMARRQDVTALTPAGAAASARRLRPSLGEQRHLDQAATGVLIGYTVSGDVPLLQSWEDMALDVWGPRSGKTTARAIPAIVDAPGPVIVTSVKGDVVDATRDVRSGVGRVWVFDPQGQLDDAPPGWWWNPLAPVTTITAARRLANHFASAEREAGDRRDPFFDVAAEELVATLFLAAAASRQTVLSAYQWAVMPDDTPVKVLQQHGYALAADSLMGVQAAPERTRGSIYAMAQKMLLSLAEPSVTRWVTPGGGRKPFDAPAFVTSRDTLYLVSRGGAGSPAPLIAGFTDAVLLAGEQASNRMPGRRLDPPLLSVLDECANIVKIQTLPDLFSHYGSRGLPILAILQSYAQGEAVWGEEGMRKLWSAANIVTYGGGVKDSRWLETLSQLIGEHDVTVRSTTQGMASIWDQSTQLQPRRQRILDVAALGAMPRGRMVVLASGTPPVLARTCPWQDGPHAEKIRASLHRWDPGAHDARPLAETPPAPPVGPPPSE